MRVWAQTRSTSAIRACHKGSNYVGTRGRRLSDQPEAGKQPVEAGIERLFINPDAVVEVSLHLPCEGGTGRNPDSTAAALELCPIHWTRTGFWIKYGNRWLMR